MKRYALLLGAMLICAANAVALEGLA